MIYHAQRLEQYDFLAYVNDCIAHEDEDKLGEHRRCDSRKNPRDGEIAAVDVSERVVIHWKSSGLERLEDSKVR